MGGKLKKRDVVVAAGTIGLLFVILVLPMLSSARDQSKRIRCVSHHKQIGLSFRIWANDNTEFYPMHRREEFGGTRESALRGELVPTFRALSTLLSVPRILTCPNDTRMRTDEWSEFDAQNISYFLGLDAVSTQPEMILLGDRNLAVDGKLLSGVVALGTNSPVRYTDAIHVQSGNIGLADGSVQQVTTELLRDQLRNSGDTTNRLVFPQ